MTGLEIHAAMAPTAAGALLANATPAFLLSVYKPVLVLLAVVPFAWLSSSVIEKDVRFYHLPLNAWNWALVGTLLAARPGMVRSVGGSPARGSDGVWYREAIFVDGRRVVFGEDEDLGALLWDLRALASGGLDAVTVTVEARD